MSESSGSKTLGVEQFRVEGLGLKKLAVFGRCWGVEANYLSAIQLCGRRPQSKVEKIFMKSLDADGKFECVTNFTTRNRRCSDY